MFSEVMEFFGLEKELDHLGFFETTSQKHLAQELKLAISQGRLIALSGVVGSGKTTRGGLRLAVQRRVVPPPFYKD